MTAEPREILQIDFQNPQFNRTDDWSKAIVAARYPIADYEWTQVLAPNEEYDLDLVGATGWMVNPHYSGGDIPFTHPFLDSSAPRPSNLLPIFDWEFKFALDRDPNNPRMDYQFLLAEGNRLAADAQEAADLQVDVPNGLLGVEIDGALVPAGFKADARSGDRVAVFGRWILDTAHQYPEPFGSFRSEIHPPLLMARARVQTLASGQPGTRVLFTSRPYLVGQRFTLNTDEIYDDSAGDDGAALAHLAKEFAKISAPIPLSLLVQAHPKIKSRPFRGVHLLHLKVRPPAQQGGRAIGHSTPRLAVSFQFTVRSGCAVQVSSSSADTVDIWISLSDAGYTPPPLPHRNEHDWKREEVFAMGEKYGFVFEAFEEGSPLLAAFLGLAPGLNVAVARAILEQGIRSDVYDPLPGVDINDAQQAVTRVWADEVPAGAGIVHSDDQPFPIFGWLEATWQLAFGDLSPIITGDLPVIDISR
jgi:hypothetical protein